jgi:hypothetical protein
MCGRRRLLLQARKLRELPSQWDVGKQVLVGLRLWSEIWKGWRLEDKKNLRSKGGLS